MDLQDFTFAGNRLALSWGKAVKIGSGPFILPTAKAPPLPPLPPPVSLPIPVPIFPLPATLPTAMSMGSAASNSASAVAIDAFLAPLPLTSPLPPPQLQGAYNTAATSVSGGGGGVNQLEAPPVFTPPPPALPFMRPPRKLYFTSIVYNIYISPILHMYTYHIYYMSQRPRLHLQSLPPHPPPSPASGTPLPSPAHTPLLRPQLCGILTLK